MTTIAPPATIAFIGLGMMGRPMAARLAEAGFKLRLFDVSQKAVSDFIGAHPTALATASAKAAAGARLVQTAIAGHAIGEAVERRPFAEGKRQIQAFYIMDLPDMDAAVTWANRLPTYGHVEVRELLQF